MDDARQQVALANRILARAGLAAGVTASSGHASMRLPDQPDRFLVKGRGYAIDALALITPDDLVLCDLDGNRLDGPPGVSQCFEVKMHSCVYRSRLDVNAVVHAHPRFVVALSVAGSVLKPCCQEGASLVRRPLPLYPHMRIVVSDDDGMAVVDALGSSPALILLGHGALTVGATLQEAVMNMLYLEEQARMNWYVRALGGDGVPDELLAELDAVPNVATQPHFAGQFPDGRRPPVTGAWDYFAFQDAHA
jgi:ribulose-5-phosphate 4-epimerase/fuculose-1-phosphate aldolase